MPKLNEILGDSFKSLPDELKDKYKDVDLVDNSNYVDKKDLDTANQTIKDYKKQLNDRDTQLNDLKDKAKDNEELSIEIEKLKSVNETVTKDYEDKLNKITFETKLEKKLGDFKPKNLNILKKALDFEKISIDGDNFLGLEEQINTIKESDAYLFVEDNPGGTGNIGGDISSFNNPNDTKTKSIGEKLAEAKTNATKASEELNNFFK